MGNFQQLAQKVLSKHCPDTKVSCFTSLGKETGNFQSKLGNSAGNLNYLRYKESQSRTGFIEETDKETSRKQEMCNEETIVIKKKIKVS